MSSLNPGSFSFRQEDAYRLIQQELSSAHGTIYYPCCGTDTTATLAWPNGRVLYLDRAQRCIDQLATQGLEAVCGDAEEYDPGPVGLLLLFNPSIDPTAPTRFVVPGGLVLCNNYHLTAQQMRQLTDFELVAILRSQPNGTMVLDRDDLGACWQEVETDDELRAAPLSWGCVSYDEAEDVVEEITGQKENILAEYRRIIEQARAQGRQKADKVKSALVAKMLRDEADHGQHVFLEQGHHSWTLNTRFPMKKGTADSIFVFRRC